MPPASLAEHEMSHIGELLLNREIIAPLELPLNDSRQQCLSNSFIKYANTEGSSSTPTRKQYGD